MNSENSTGKIKENREKSIEIYNEKLRKFQKKINLKKRKLHE